MILIKLLEQKEQDPSFILFNIMGLITISMVILIFLFLNFNVWLVALSLLLLTEIFYHVLPRTKEEKKKGRDYLNVLGFKIDAITDASLVLGIIFGTYKLSDLFGWEKITSVIIKGCEYAVIVIAIFLLLWLYLWLNKLRDTKKVKTK